MHRTYSQDRFQYFNDLKMPIPATCPSSSIIKIKYILKLIVNSAEFSLAKYVKIPIEIGTVPILAENELFPVCDKAFDKKTF